MDVELGNLDNDILLLREALDDNIPLPRKALLENSLNLLDPLLVLILELHLDREVSELSALSVSDSTTASGLTI
ncbi:hypothetical protein HYZ05_01520 [Candidatus Daviesbacteria bacterium]|nr:hypothetical protein [Candidatus Daviesbacteria bacterium]